jgi:hypothetical protein
MPRGYRVEKIVSAVSSVGRTMAKEDFHFAAMKCFFFVENCNLHQFAT